MFVLALRRFKTSLAFTPPVAVIDLIVRESRESFALCTLRSFLIGTELQ